MDNPSLLYWIVITVAVLVIIYLFIDSKKLSQHLIDAREELDELKRHAGRALPASSTTKASKGKKEKETKKLEAKSGEDQLLNTQEFKELKEREAQLGQELSDAKEELKRAKQQLYDVRQNYQDVKKEKEELLKKPKVSDSDTVFALRQELADAKASYLNLKDDYKSLEKKVNKLNEATSQPEEAEPYDPTKTYRMIPAVQDLSDRTPSQVEEKKPSVDLEEALKEQRAQLEKQFKQSEKSLNSEVDKLKDRVKELSLDLTKEKRRSENNDKAYKITQRQLDVTNERIAHYEKLMKKATVAIEQLERKISRLQGVASADKSAAAETKTKQKGKSTEKGSVKPAEKSTPREEVPSSDGSTQSPKESTSTPSTDESKPQRDPESND